MEKAKTHYLLDSFEIEGRWYLPGENVDEDGVFGTLKFSPDEIVLHVQGSFAGYDVFDDDINDKLTIFGYSNNGEHISLFGCSLSSASQSYPGFLSSSYYVSKFYGGDFVVEDESVLENYEADFSFLNLDAWLQYQAMTFSFSKELKSAEIQIDMDSKRIDKRSYSVRSAGIKISEEISYVIQHPQDWFLEEATKVSFRRNYHVSLDGSDMISFQMLFEFMQNYRRLLVLLVGAPMYFSYIEFEAPDGKIEFKGEERTRFQKVRLFYRQVGDIVNSRHLSPHKPRSILLRHSDIAEHFDDIINKWYDEQEAFQNVSSAFISDLYLPGYVENEFLNCAKGLEAYHRYFVDVKRVCNKEDSNAEREADCQKIIDFIERNVLEKNQNYFISRVNYKEETTFRIRLKNLVDELPENLKTILLGGNNTRSRNKFIIQVVDTRNFLTHRGNKSGYKNAINEIVPLMRTARQLSWILQYYCLTEAGIDPVVAEKRLCEKWY